MMNERVGPVEWDGDALAGWVTNRGKLMKVVPNRDTIHCHAPGFNDALTWEIKQHGIEIFDKLIPFFPISAARVATTEGSPMLTDPILDQLNLLGLAGMAKAFTEIEASDEAWAMSHAEWRW